MDLRVRNGVGMGVRWGIGVGDCRNNKNLPLIGGTFTVNVRVYI